MRDYYEYQHIVGFEETDVTGYVHYVNYLRWQGRCREMFLQAHATDVLADIRRDLKLFTLHVSCQFFGGLEAFDRLSVRMLLFVARGRQRVACMRGPNRGTRPAPVPASLRAALAEYAPGSAVDTDRGARRLSGAGGGR